MNTEFMQLEKDRDYAAAKQLLENMNIVDIAAELEEMEEQTAVKIFRMMPKDKAADVFAYLSRDIQQNIVGAITDREIQGIIDDLFLDDVVDFIEEMPANVVKRVLANVTKDKREIINHFLKYPEDSAGSIMTIEFVDLKIGYTVADAFADIRRTGVDKETIYTCYAIDNNRKLMGAVSARSLLLAEREQKISDIMEANIIYAYTTDDKETLAINFRKYGLLAMPVVDNEKRLVGIVTVDDVLEVQEEEATEDFELMAAISPSEEPYLKTSILQLTKNRIIWLMLLMLTATITGAVISGFEEGLAVLPVLVAFIPMLMDTGGNAGSQSATLIIRGMALDEIKLSDMGAVLWKELRVSLLCGAALVAVNFVRVVVTNRNIPLAVTVSLALYATIITAKTVGCLLPMAAKKLKLDPAVMASPVITTIVDTVTLLIYFGLAKLILHI